MKLVDLNPKWYTINGIDREGFTFLCPHCLKTRLAIDCRRWTIDGDSFDDISVSPSVDASKSGHWHGNIIQGLISPLLPT